MSLKFEEVIAKRGLSLASTAPHTGIRLLDLSSARTGYQFISHTNVEDAPNYGFKFVDAKTAEEINVWLRFTEGMANPTLNWGVVKTLTAEWLEEVRAAAEDKLECELVYACTEHDMAHFLTLGRVSSNTAEDHATSIIHAFRRHIGKDQEALNAQVECYETAPGRRYRIKAYMGGGFWFKLGLLMDSKLAEGSLYGTTRLRDATYRFEIHHAVLGDQLAAYYGAEELRAIVDRHLRQYAGDLRAAISREDLTLDFEGITQ